MIFAQIKITDAQIFLNSLLENCPPACIFKTTKKILLLVANTNQLPCGGIRIEYS